MASLPPLNALRAFEAAARLHSVSLAAQELHVTHGAVSRQIQVLEAHLGQALFRRVGRGVEPTAAGQSLQRAATEAFGTLQRAVETLRRPTRTPALVLGCPGSILARWMIPRMQRLQQELPALTLHLHAHEGEFDPALPGLDLALLLSRPPWPAGWRVHTLAAERIGPVLSPQHAAAEALAADAAPALLAHPLLHTASRPQAWPAWAASQGLDPAQLRYGTGFEHLYYLLEAATAGLGIAIAPEPLVRDDLRSGRLIAPWGFSETGGSWALCLPPGTSDDARVQGLANWLTIELQRSAPSPSR
jgi:DNA-binding transcriptional LysR family regulator